MNQGRPLNIAHRGFRAIAPENTLAAARAGHAVGADWWELDVAASSDGELVVMHDDSLVRTTDAKRRFPEREPWCVYDFSLEDLGSLDAGTWFIDSDPFGQIAEGAIAGSPLLSYRGEAIPTLRAALELTKSAGWKVNVEIKDATGRACDAWIVERTTELVRKLDMVDRVFISSFNHDYLRRSRRAEPRIPLGVLVEPGDARFPPDFDMVGYANEIGAQAWHPGLEGLEEGRVRAARAAGLGVNVWTVNSEADMRRLVGWGVTGLFTDFPDRLSRVLAESSPVAH